MNTVTDADRTALINEIFHGNTTLLVHLLFADVFKTDHHLTVAVSIENGDNQESLKFKAKTKAENTLKRKKAQTASIVTLTDEEYHKLGYDQFHMFYVVFQNGTRKYCHINALDPDKAAEIFRQRFPGIELFKILEKKEGAELKTTGGWRTIILNLN